MWAILDNRGEILATFDDDQAAYDATYTGYFPDDCEVAYIN